MPRLRACLVQGLLSRRRGAGGEEVRRAQREDGNIEIQV
jgi:hypothetical protein